MKINTEEKKVLQEVYVTQQVPVSVSIDIEHFKFLTKVLGNTNSTDRTEQGIEPDFNVSHLYSAMNDLCKKLT